MNCPEKLAGNVFPPKGFGFEHPVWSHVDCQESWNFQCGQRLWTSIPCSTVGGLTLFFQDLLCVHKKCSLVLLRMLRRSKGLALPPITIPYPQSRTQMNQDPSLLLAKQIASAAAISRACATILFLLPICRCYACAEQLLLVAV